MQRIALASSLAGALWLAAAPAASAAEYAIDPSHTFIQFGISHLGFSTLAGRFNTFEGSYRWDKDAPADSSIEITIDTASVDTNWAERDKHLRGEDFLHVSKYPKATFKSTGYEGDGTGGRMEGELTLNGVTKPITLDVRVVGEGTDPWGGYRSGFSATTTLRRADFGISYDLGPAAETMNFDLHIEGIRK